MLNNRLFRRTARILNRGGFTLVELLVVIGIIAILAGVALGPITNGIKKAKQSAGVQTSHALGLAMYSFSNDNSQTYPDVSSGDASNVARLLLAGGYVSDAGIFFISGDPAGSKFAGTNAAGNIVKTNVSWDFLSNKGSGASSTSYTYMPLLWSTAGTTPPSVGSLTANASVVASLPIAAPLAPFQTDGMAIFYINNSAAFVSSQLSGSAYNVTMLTTSNDSSGSGSNYTVLSGS